METSNESPRAPSQATRVKKNIIRNVSDGRSLRHIVKSQKILNIINSNLRSVLRRCFREEINAMNPHRIPISAGLIWSQEKIIISFNSLKKTLVL